MVKEIGGKTAFVTGADGFIGSHLVEQLVRDGVKVRALVYYNSWNEVGWLKDIDKKLLNEIEIYHGDIRDAERIRKGVAGCEYVFHLSSLIAIPYSYEAPRSYVETNVNGVMNVLEACRNSDSLTRLVHVSTSEVYGSAQIVPIPESHPLVGQSPYSATKIAADKMVESYFLSFGLPVVTARPFNTFGPRQTARAVIPTVASQLIAGVKELKLGSLSPTRDFNFVSDTANGMIELSVCEAANGRVVNIGSGEEWSISETVDILCEIVGARPEIISDESRIRPAKSEVNRLIADNSLIKKITPWTRQVDFKQGLEKTVRWITKNIEYFDVEKYAR